MNPRVREDLLVLGARAGWEGTRCRWVPGPPLRGVRAMPWAMLPGSDGGSRARRCCLSMLPASRRAGDRCRLLRCVTCPGARAQAREGFVQKSQERVEGGNKGTPAAWERLPLLAVESAGQ